MLLGAHWFGAVWLSSLNETHTGAGTHLLEEWPFSSRSRGSFSVSTTLSTLVADTTPAHPPTKREVIAAFLAFGAASVVSGGLIAVNPPLPLTFLGAAVSAGMAVGEPLVGEQLASLLRIIVASSVDFNI